MLRRALRRRGQPAVARRRVERRGIDHALAQRGRQVDRRRDRGIAENIGQAAVAAARASGAARASLGMIARRRRVTSRSARFGRAAAQSAMPARHAGGMHVGDRRNLRVSGTRVVVGRRAAVRIVRCVLPAMHSARRLRSSARRPVQVGGEKRDQAEDRDKTPPAVSITEHQHAHGTVSTSSRIIRIIGTPGHAEPDFSWV